MTVGQMTQMTVGQQLQRTRTERKLSFNDVTAATKIQSWVLEALESDRLPELMSPVYVKGFLSTYARFLKLDPVPLVAGLRWPALPEAEQPQAQQEDIPPVPQRKAAAVARTAPAAAEPVPVMAQRAKDEDAEEARERPKRALPKFQLPQLQLPRFQLPRIQFPQFQMPRVRLPRIPLPVWLRAGQVVAAAGIVAAVIALHPIQHLKQVKWPAVHLPKIAKAEPKAGGKRAAAKSVVSKKPAAASVVKVQTARDEKEDATRLAAPKVAGANIAPVSDALKPPAPPAPQPIALEPLELVVTANRTTWIKVRADGKLLTQQRLSRGANERWIAKKQFEVIVSKPSQVDLTLNGQSISPFAIAHRGRLLITHRGVVPLPEQD